MRSAAKSQAGSGNLAMAHQQGSITSVQKPAPVNNSSYTPLKCTERTKKGLKRTKKGLNSVVKQPLSLVSNATGGAALAGLGGGGCRLSLGEQGRKRGETLEVQSLPQSHALQKTGGIFCVFAGKVDPSPAPAGFRHHGAWGEGTRGHSRCPALRGALRARQNICRNKITKPPPTPDRGCAGGPTKAQ